MLLTRTGTGPSPLTTAVARSFLRQDSTADDQVIASIIAVATEHAEAYVGREIRPNVYELLLDEFCDRVALGRTPVASVSSVDRLVANAWVAVPSSVYFLKNSLFDAEVVLRVDQSWPEDADEVEHAVRVLFTTKECPDTPAIVEGIKRHVAALYQDRGDVGPMTTGGGPDGQTRFVTADTAKTSGAEAIYDPYRVPRI